jgi:hypothetical protein
MCSGRETSDADKNRAIPFVALQQKSLFALKDRAEEPMARVPKMTRGKIFGTRHLLLSQFLCFFLPNHRLYTARNVCSYTHNLQRGVYA